MVFLHVLQAVPLTATMAEYTDHSNRRKWLASLGPNTLLKFLPSNINHTVNRFCGSSPYSLISLSQSKYVSSYFFILVACKEYTTLLSSFSSEMSYFCALWMTGNRTFLSLTALSQHRFDTCRTGSKHMFVTWRLFDSFQFFSPRKEFGMVHQAKFMSLETWIKKER